MLILRLLICILLSASPLFGETYIHQRCFNNVDMPQLFPKDVHETIMVVKDYWKFDGFVFSMDALINEFGTDERKFKTHMEQLSKDLDFLQLTKSYPKRTFRLHLDVDYVSDISKDISVHFKSLAIIETVSHIPIDTITCDLNAYQFGKSGIEIGKIPKANYTTIKVNSGRDYRPATEAWDVMNFEDRFKYGNSAILLTKPATWYLMDNTKVRTTSTTFNAILQRRDQK